MKDRFCFVMIFISQESQKFSEPCYCELHINRLFKYLNQVLFVSRTRRTMSDTNYSRFRQSNRIYSLRRISSSIAYLYFPGARQVRWRPCVTPTMDRILLSLLSQLELLVT
ncbi:hypothetical protein M6B38_318605 [Iris pallida]|uniref:Uncharacterized protein n=1 Tax=Iris pallida TaxID=29817 RepID=A0AAX6HC80_IRIPA|nr:hypothetical protein M6B38_318605 [Iris pallida]